MSIMKGKDGTSHLKHMKSLFAFLMFVLLPLQQNVAFGAAPQYGIELLEGGSFEMNISSPVSSFENSAWEVVVGTWGTRGLDERKAQDGTYFLYGGTSALSELKQDVDLVAYSSAIEQGQQRFIFDGYLSDRAGWDRAQIIIEMRSIECAVSDSASGCQIKFIDSGEYKDRLYWRSLATSFIVPSWTNVLRVRLIATRSTGTPNDGYFDNISLRALSPTAFNEQLLENGSVEWLTDTTSWQIVSGRWNRHVSTPSPQEGKYYFETGYDRSVLHQ